MSKGIKSPHRLTKAGDTEALSRVMWLALRRVGRILQKPDALEDAILHVASTAATLAGAYSNVTKTHALEAELTALQEESHELRATLSRPATTDQRSSQAEAN